jgi:hypothetical protein
MEGNILFFFRKLEGNILGSLFCDKRNVVMLFAGVKAFLLFVLPRFLPYFVHAHTGFHPYLVC